MLDLTHGDMITMRRIWTPRAHGDGAGKVDPSFFYTVVGVKPGDALRIYHERPILPDPVRQETLVVDGARPGFDQMFLSAPCVNAVGSVPFPFQATLHEYCILEGDFFQLLLQTRVGGALDQWAAVSNAPFDPSGTTHVDVTGLWRNDWHDVTVELPLPGFPTRSINAAAAGIRNGEEYPRLALLGWEGLSNPPSEMTLRVPRGIPDLAYLSLNHENFDGQWEYLESRTALDTTVTRLVQPAPRVSLGAVPSFDFDGPERPSMSWNLDRGGAAGDGLLLALSWQIEGALQSWTILLPPGATGFQLPELPAELAGFMPPAPDPENPVSISVRFEDDSFVDGYDARRNLGVLTPVLYTDRERAALPGWYVEVGAIFDTGSGFAQGRPERAAR